MRQLVSVLKKKTLILQHTQEFTQKKTIPKCKKCRTIKNFFRKLKTKSSQPQSMEQFIKSIKLNIEELMFVKM